MKKILSLTLSFVMLISCCISAFATFAVDVPTYTLGDSFTAKFNSLTTNDTQYYAKFVAPETKYYEFTLDTGLPASSRGEVETGVFNSKYETLSYNFSDSETTAPPTVAAKMTKGQTYYFGMYAEDCGTFTTNVTINVHSEHKYFNFTMPAFCFPEDDMLSDGYTVKGCEYCDYEKKMGTHYYIKNFTLSKTSYTYDGKTKKPSVTVKDRKGNKVDKSNYTVRYSNNKKVGTATVTIELGSLFDDNSKYFGEITKTFKINPKGTNLSSVSGKKKGFTVKWKKQTTQTTGYQIQYATDSKFTKNKKTVTVSKNSTTSKTVSNLKAKKKYYVKVRTYKTVSGKKYYSAWSNAKSVTTKK